MRRTDRDRLHDYRPTDDDMRSMGWFKRPDGVWTTFQAESRRWRRIEYACRAYERGIMMGF